MGEASRTRDTHLHLIRRDQNRLLYEPRVRPWFIADRRTLEGARLHGPNSVRAMEHAQELIRPWRRATIVVTTVAGIELVLIAGLSVALLGNPLARHLQTSAKAAGEPLRRSEVAKPVVQKPTLPRGEVSVMVLNANGRAGAAHAAADRIRARGYVIGNVGNAPSSSPRTLVMYRPGYAAEGARLGRDLRIRTVRPLDGMRPSQLVGSHLLLILGR